MRETGVGGCKVMRGGRMDIGAWGSSSSLVSLLHIFFTLIKSFASLCSSPSLSSHYHHSCLSFSRKVQQTITSSNSSSAPIYSVNHTQTPHTQASSTPCSYGDLRQALVLLPGQCCCERDWRTCEGGTFSWWLVVKGVRGRGAGGKNGKRGGNEVIFSYYILFSYWNSLQLG